MPSIGDMRERITIQSRTDAQSSSGQVNPTWGTFATLWAKVTEGAGGAEGARIGEFFTAGTEQGATSARFEFRYAASLSALNARDHRISYNSKTWDLVSVTRDGRRWFDCMAVTLA